MKQEDALKLADEALEKLAAELQNGQSQTLKQFLEVMARFPRYSFRNVMLITSQFPEATQVAGFRTWQSLGRYVRKGEHGIGIVAPMVGRKTESGAVPADQSDSPAEATRLFGFRVVHVFDLSQTEGDELPEISQPVGDPGEFLAQLETAIRSFGITLDYATIPEGALGMAMPGKIVVQPNLTPTNRFAVLAHEAGHALLHFGKGVSRPSKMIRELEAESVAHVVCRACGIESTSSSRDYIQLYDGNVAALAGSLQAIQAASARLLLAMSGTATSVQAGLSTLAA